MLSDENLDMVGGGTFADETILFANPVYDLPFQDNVKEKMEEIEQFSKPIWITTSTPEKE